MLSEFLELNELTLEYYRNLRKRNNYLAKLARRTAVLNWLYASNRISPKQADLLYWRYIVGWSFGKGFIDMDDTRWQELLKKNTGVLVD